PFYCCRFCNFNQTQRILPNRNCRRLCNASRHHSSVSQCSRNGIVPFFKHCNHVFFLPTKTSIQLCHLINYFSLLIRPQIVQSWKYRWLISCSSYSFYCL